MRQLVPVVSRLTGSRLTGYWLPMIRPKLWWLWWVLPVLTVVLFSPVYRAGFVYDDADYVEHNPLLTAPKLNVAAVFTTAYPPQHPEQKLYRPLVTLSFALDKAVWGKPAGFHVTNVLWHLAVVAMVVLLLRQLGTPPTSTLLVAAAWLAWHPLTTEAVAWVAGRAELLAAFFGLASLVAFRRDRPVLAGMVFAAALLCKESAIMTPVLAVLLEWRWPQQNRTGIAPCQLPKDTSEIVVAPVHLRIQRRWQAWASYVIVSLAYLAWRQHFFADVRMEQVAYTGFADAVTQRVVAGKVLAWYLALALVPYPQSVFHEVQVETIRSAIAVALLVGLTVWVWWRHDRYPNLALGWTWFFVALIPVSNLFIPIGSVMAERFTYLPLIGGSLVLYGWRGRGWAVGGMLVLVLALHAGQTVVRCRDWQSDRQLWRSAARVEPAAFLPPAQLGFVALAEHDRPGAIAEFDRALAALATQPVKIRQQFEPRILSAQTDAELELVHQLARQHQLEAAQTGYRELLNRHPGEVRARRALVDCQMELHDFAGAAGGLGNLVREFPHDALLRAKYGKALSGTGQIEEACRQLQRAVELDPGTMQYRRHLLALLKLKAQATSY